jgi:hypothetical protein
MPHVCFAAQGLTAVVRRLACEWQQGNVARLLDRRRNRTLVPGAGTGLAARADGTIFGHVLPKQICLLVVYCQSLVCAELTKFWFRKKTAFAAAFLGTVRSSIFSHVLLQFCFHN